MIQTMRELRTHINSGKPVYVVEPYIGVVPYRIVFSRAGTLVKYSAFDDEVYNKSLLFHDAKRYIQRVEHFRTKEEAEAFRRGSDLPPVKENQNVIEQKQLSGKELFQKSIEDARQAGVPEEKILKSKEEIDSFFM